MCNLPPLSRRYRFPGSSCQWTVGNLQLDADFFPQAVTALAFNETFRLCRECPDGPLPCHFTVCNGPNDPEVDKSPNEGQGLASPADGAAGEGHPVLLQPPGSWRSREPYRQGPARRITEWPFLLVLGTQGLSESESVQLRELAV